MSCQPFCFIRIAFSSILTVVLALASVVVAEDQQVVSREQQKFFEQHVRPLLVQHCFECHSEKKQKGALRMDSIGSILAGGESGPSLVPEKPEESLLLEAVRYESFEMPPSGKLPEEEIAILEQWIKMGAPWPGGNRTTPTGSIGPTITDEDRQFWSFQPLASISPPAVEDGGWSRNDIDHFIYRKLSANQLTPASEAPKQKLIRRLYFNLIGLPPTPDQVDAFLSDTSDGAYMRLVDELLASPQYGEHWGRFWLDLVRYADSDGFRKDDYRPDAWKYRDYVISSFNSDKPFDQFTREQIAGDEIAPHNPDALAATGFLRHGIYEYNQRDARTQWQDMLNDITDTVGDTFLGMGMGCARCHDHKFDPILQKDYFRLQAFFANISMPYSIPLATPEQKAEYAKQLAIWEEATVEIREKLDSMNQPMLEKMERDMVKMFPADVQAMVNKADNERTSYEKQICHLVHLQVIDKQKTLPTSFKGDDKKTWESLNKELAKFDHLKPEPLPTGMTVSEYGTEPPPVFIPSKQRLGEILPGFLTIFDPNVAHVDPMPETVESSGRRTVLADWLTKENHPLTTRVIVNRIWKQHFGTGIVDSPSDFGHLGEAPSHPELLDWLANEFVNNGWSLKWLHRKIVLSATYRQSSLRIDPQAQNLDPTNRLYWKANVRRLTGEQIRDAQLAVAGKLDSRSGGPGESASSSKRRSVYAKVMRNSQDQFLAAFDFPDRMTSSPSRNVTTSPSQSLLLINGEWTLNRAKEFARRIYGEGNQGTESILRDAYQIAFGRSPEEMELQRLVEYVDAAKDAQGEQNNLPQIQTQVLEVSDDSKSPPVQTESSARLPTEAWTIQATVFLRSLYPDATVRTIVSQWDSSTSHPGWALGVTSTKSAHMPRNLIFQFVGKNAAGNRTYEVVASAIHLELNHPYEVTASVDLSDSSEAGVLFVVRDVMTNEVQTANVAHRVVKSEENSSPLILGGRDKQKRHRWNGWIDQVRLLNVTLSKEQILDKEFKPASDTIVAMWEFDSTEYPITDTVTGRKLFAQGNANEPPVALVDVCQVLLNSNEFIYID